MKDIRVVLGNSIQFIFNKRLVDFSHKICETIYSIWISGLPFKSIKHTHFAGDAVIRMPRHISIGDKSSFEKHIVLTVWPDLKGSNPNACIEIGNNCTFNEYTHITCANNIKIGNNVLVGRWVTITDNGHGDSSFECLEQAPVLRPIYSKGPVVIEDNVWIGDKATILPGVIIGKGSIIAANSVVTKDIPPFSVAAGNPAVIKKNYSNK